MGDGAISAVFPWKMHQVFPIIAKRQSNKGKNDSIKVQFSCIVQMHFIVSWCPGITNDIHTIYDVNEVEFRT